MWSKVMYYFHKEQTELMKCDNKNNTSFEVLSLVKHSEFLFRNIVWMPDLAGCYTSIIALY